MSARKNVVVVGGGFGGLAAADRFARAGSAVTLLEAEQSLGGLAGAFEHDGRRIDKFYHHWFLSDRAIFNWIAEMGWRDDLMILPGTTGHYYANSIFRMSSPADLLRFDAIPLRDRLRVAAMILRVRRIRDYAPLEAITAKDWLIEQSGRRAFDVLWEPLLRGKFGQYADSLAAVWIANKFKLRGSSARRGRSYLAYFRGGFGALLDRIRCHLESIGVEIQFGRRVRSITQKTPRAANANGGRVELHTDAGSLRCDAVLVTTALPPFLRMLPGDVTQSYADTAARIPFLDNVCLVLSLDRSLSESYWVNVADPSFPFVGIIEHTQFDTEGNYGGHLIYLSKYLVPDHPMTRMSADELKDLAVPEIQRLFPAFDESWIRWSAAWHGRYAQPVVIKDYRSLIPAHRTPVPGVYLSTMAQVYPEDRGTNYAVAYGRRVADQILAEMIR